MTVGAERYVAVSGGSTVISRKKEYKMPIKISLGTDHRKSMIFVLTTPLESYDPSFTAAFTMK